MTDELEGLLELLFATKNGDQSLNKEKVLLETNKTEEDFLESDNEQDRPYYNSWMKDFPQFCCRNIKLKVLREDWDWDAGTCLSERESGETCEQKTN